MARATNSPRFPCGICDKSYPKPHLFQHRREKHGVYGGESGRTRSDRRSQAQATLNGQRRSTAVALVEAPAPAKPVKPSFKVLPFLVLEDQDGRRLIAEYLD